MSFEILNFILIICGFTGLSLLYLLSLEPKKRSLKIGEKAWKQSKNLRFFAFFFEIIGTISLILWNWFPIQALDWRISMNPQIPFFVGLGVGIICMLVMTIGVLQAGSESLAPSEKTKLHSGIYSYIRHPQALGEFPIFIAVALMINSLSFAIIMIVYNLIFLPVMIKIEEADLICRFGDLYIEYRKKTGAFFPKIRK